MPENGYFFLNENSKIDHCGMGGKRSITHFLQFSATFGPQEVEPSHDIYICRIVTHITSRPTTTKVIIHKSRGEVSLAEQDTVENVSQPI